jgi:hypothetical protein
MMLTNTSYLLAQNRKASHGLPIPVSNLAVEPRLQASLDLLTQSLKANPNSPQDKLKDLFFTEPEFDAIFEQTYNQSPGQKDKTIFQQKKSDVLSLLNQFRNPNLQTQVLNVQERSGDNSLRAMVVTIKFTHQNLNRIAKLIMIKFNQTYKIMMLDE